MMNQDDIYATKDKYLREKYSDSSDEDANAVCLEKFELCKSKKSKNSPVKFQHLNQSEKPHLGVSPRSPKEPYICNGEILIPAMVNQYLHQYQREGVFFLWKHFKKNGGCILADDMGLGKTIQVICLFISIQTRREKKESPFLVIAPTSVLYNWFDEMKTWGDFNVGMFHRENKQNIIEHSKSGQVDAVLTTHETMRLYLDMMSEVKWSIVVFDEVHRIKEPKSFLTIAAKQLPSYCRIGLTGTPVQNNLKELWCLLDWANPNCLGSCDDFEERFAKPISVGQRFNANKRELATARKKQQELALLHKSWMLRRTKDMIQDQLPNKEEKIVFCPISRIQAAVYEEILKLPKCKMLMALDVNCRCGSQRIGRKCCLKKYSWRQHLFPFIQLFLRLSNHAALILPSQTKQKKSGTKKLADEVRGEIFKNLPESKKLCTGKRLSNLSNVALCGKMLVLQKLLIALLHRKDKILIFSNSTRLLSIIEAYLMSRGLIYRRIDGKTSAKRRQEIMKEYNNDDAIPICLLSTLVGSLGMNFTGANVVIIFDPMWNPSYERQAQDRAYRIGQQRDVCVYRFISLGTIEENIYMRQIYKQQLSNIAIEMSTERRYFTGVAGNTQYRGELFGISNMFKFNRGHNSSFVDKVFGRSRHRENGVEVAKYEPVNNDKEFADDVVENDNDADDYALSASQNVAEELILSDSEEENDGKKEVPSSKSVYAQGTEKREHGKTIEETLAECNVSFAPSTNLLLGSSKREMLLSKHAIKDVFWHGLNSQDAANDDDVMSESDESQDVGSAELKHSNKRMEGESKNPKSRDIQMFERIGSVMFMIGGTPPQMISKQFQLIAECEGYQSVEDFANFIINKSENECRAILRKYYVTQEPSIKSVSSFNQIYGSQVSTRCSANRFSVCIERKRDSISRSNTITTNNDSTTTINRKSIAKTRRKRKKIHKSVAYVDSSTEDESIDYFAPLKRQSSSAEKDKAHCQNVYSNENAMTTTKNMTDHRAKANIEKGVKDFILISCDSADKLNVERSDQQSFTSNSQENNGHGPYEQNTKLEALTPEKGRVNEEIRKNEANTYTNLVDANSILVDLMSPRVFKNARDKNKHSADKCKVEENAPSATSQQNKPKSDSETIAYTQEKNKECNGNYVNEQINESSLTTDIKIKSVEFESTGITQIELTNAFNNKRNSDDKYVNSDNQNHSILDELLDFKPTRLNTNSNQKKPSNEEKVKKTYTSILDELMG